MSNSNDRSTPFSNHKHLSDLLNHPPPQVQPYAYPEPSQPHNLYPHPPIPHDNGLGNPFDSQSQAEVKTRLGKACDSCSLRKVKCDAGQPCRPCASLDIPCTFRRPTRRRGPPNRHAEAIKRQRTEDHIPLSQLHVGDEPQSAPAAFSAESICPMPILELLFDDYFTYIHPLIPLPHEPTFRLQMRRRDDLHDRTFLAVAALMIAVLVASFPRQPRQLLASEEMRKRFPSADALIELCLNVSQQSRGIGYLSRPLTVYDALCSYLYATTTAYMYDMRKGRLYFGENLLILRNLRLHRRPEEESTLPSVEVSGVSGGPGPLTPEEVLPNQVDYVEREMTRRLFWVSYVSNQHMRQLGSEDADLLLPPFSERHPPPPLPLELDDMYISKTHIAQPPPGSPPSELVGFNANVSATLAMNDLAAHELAANLIGTYDVDQHKRVITKCLEETKRATAFLPPELMLNPAKSAYNGWPSLEHKMPQNAPKGHNDRLTRGQIQYEIQKANFYVTELMNRSLLMEKYQAVCASQRHPPRKAGDLGSMTVQQFLTKPDPSKDGGHIPAKLQEQASRADQLYVGQESDAVVKDLAMLLSSVNQVSMEPNGASFCHKVRYIASNLLNSGPGNRLKGSTLDYDAVQSYLSGFLYILIKLERIGGSTAPTFPIGSGSRGLPPSPSPGPSEDGFSSVEGNDYGGGGGGGGEGVDPGVSNSAEDVEERELLQWASLKAHQESFIRQQGWAQMWHPSGDPLL